MTARNPSNREAVIIARDLRKASVERIDSSDGQLYAERRSIKTHASWRVRKAGDNNANDVTARAARRGEGTVAIIDTRNRKAVLDVLDALAPFHRSDTL